SRGAATISLPAADVPEGQTRRVTSSAQLQSMPAAPVAKESSVSVAIEEDLSPAELLERYPPDPNAILSPGTDEPAWKRYGRASTVSRDARRVALVITGLGTNRTDTVRAITGAPPEASLSFAADATDLAAWIAAARAYGH